jgi:hypothetical protein
MGALEKTETCVPQKMALLFSRSCLLAFLGKIRIKYTLNAFIRRNRGFCV